MMTPFPHQYEITLSHVGPSTGEVDAPPRPPLFTAPPPELGGPDDRWSPEQLLLSALAGCLLATFQALAARDHLVATAWTAHASARLDRGSQGLELSGFRLEVNVTVPDGDVPRAEGLLARAKRHCVVANALRLPVELVATVVSAGPRH